MACGTPVAALDRGAVREVVDDGVTGIVFDDLDQMAAGLRACSRSTRRRVRERAVARFGVERMVDEYVAVYRASSRRIAADAQLTRLDFSGRTILAVFAHPDDESLACGGTLARLADAGARVVVLCASRGERGPSATSRSSGTATRPRRAPHELHEAARTLGIAEVLIGDHPDGDLRWAHVPEFHAEIVAAHRALPSGRRHHVRRRRPVLAPRSHRRPRAHVHRRAVARRRRAAALLRHDADRA